MRKLRDCIRKSLGWPEEAQVEGGVVVVGLARSRRDAGVSWDGAVLFRARGHIGRCGRMRTLEEMGMDRSCRRERKDTRPDLGV